MQSFKAIFMYFLLFFMITISMFSDGHDRGGQKHRRHHRPSPTTRHIHSGNTVGCNFTRVACDRQIKFRSITGFCNNLRHPEFGSAYSTFKRVLHATYNGGGTPRGGNPSTLPSARMVSRTVHDILDISDTQHSHMLMQWGQFLDHDITLTPVIEADCSSCQATDDACFQISIPSGDPVFSDDSCMEFTRSSNGNPNGQREQLNQITSFIDASNVYGSEVGVSRELRSFEGGKLKVGNSNMLPVSESQTGCNTTQLTGNQGCFLAGDIRNTEQNALASIQTLWVREHNKIAEALADLAPSGWDDQKLYLETRRIVGALMQRITYNEFLPPVIGETIMQNMGILEETGDTFFHGYNDNCDATITNEFATAGFRFGHSLVHSLMAVHKQSGPTLTTETHSLDGNFFNPYYLYQDPANVNGLLLGACADYGQKFDVNLDNILRNHLFKGPDLGLDLAALNIQRGRDHGIPGYKAYRDHYGFSAVGTWDDLNSIMADPSAVNAMETVYGANGVGDVDLFTGMLAEISMNNNVQGLLGEVGRRLVADQFKKLKHCDRFFYSSDHHDNKGKFTSEQLLEIRKMKLSTVLCNHLDENAELPEYVMMSGGTKKSCSELKNNYMDLSKFVTSGSSNNRCFRSESVPVRCTPEAETPPEQPDFGVRLGGGNDCPSSHHGKHKRHGHH